MSSPKIPDGLQSFLRHAESLHPSNNARGENGFAKEFQQLKDMSSQLKKDPEYSTHQGELEHNRPKNRYKDIVPFDHNRIILPSLPGKPGSDYINGNYIKGPDGKIAYLALQGPLPRTVDDFWRVIASHKCQIVIMVCREVEMGKLKCKKYWPETKDEKLNFAGLEISLISVEDIAEGFIMRTINMKSGKEDMMITQLQYTAWPDHDVPPSATPLLEMNKTLRAIQGNRKQQILVHCSAGCGRTGTICAVDYAWSLLKMQKTANFSVYNIVGDLRRQRMAMVQTKEQYALVYKAVVQLVHEEFDRERINSHTYVNVELPTSPQYSPGNEDYENFEFLSSVSRWRQNDRLNESSPKPSVPLPCPPLPSPKETKSSSKLQLANKPKLSKLDGAAVAKPSAQANGDYVNLDFPPKVMKTPPISPARETAAPFAAPLSPVHRANLPNASRARMGSGGPAEKQKSPINSDYEVVPKKRTPSPVFSPGNEVPPPTKKVISSDYEFPSVSAKREVKKAAVHVPEGLLIDLGDDVPPVPSKRHSVGSVSKNGAGARYENVEVKPVMPSGVGSTSSPNIQDDLLIHGSSYLQPTSESPRQDVRPENVKGSVDNKGFSTVPNRIHVDTGPKRCPLAADLFQGPSITATGNASSGGSEMKNSQSGPYCLLGIPSSNITTPQPNLELQHQRQKPIDEDPRKALHVQSQVPPNKQSEPSKQGPKVGAYTLVGIPEAGGQVIKPTSVFKPAPYSGNDARGNVAILVKDKGNGFPVEGNRKAIAEPSYELVEHRQLPGKMVPANPVQQPKLENASLDVRRDARRGVHGSPLLNRADKQHIVAKSSSLPDVSHRGSAEGEAQSTDDLTVGPDLYASVSPKNRTRPDDKGTNGNTLSGGTPSLRTPNSSGSLQSIASTSSNGGDSPPAVPEKTNDAFLVPGDEPYEAVQQTNKGSLGGRFKKIVKNNSKGSLPKRLSDLTNPVGHSGNGTPKHNSLGSSNVVVPWDDIGYKKRVDKPKGPRRFPAHWPTFGYLGL